MQLSCRFFFYQTTTLRNSYSQFFQIFDFPVLLHCSFRFQIFRSLVHRPSRPAPPPPRPVAPPPSPRPQTCQRWTRTTVTTTTMFTASFTCHPHLIKPIKSRLPHHRVTAPVSRTVTIRMSGSMATTPTPSVPNQIRDYQTVNQNMK